MRRWAALAIVWVLGAISGSMVGWTSALFTSTTSNPGNSFTAAGDFCSTPGSQTVATTQDTYVDQASPTTNFGAAAELRVRSQTGSSNRRALIHFSLPSKPAGCLVSSAILRLYATAVASGRTIEAYRLSSAWTETGVTWNTPPPATVGSPATSASGSAAGWKEWNVTSQVDLMYSGSNNGFLLKDASESAPSAFEQVYQSEDGSPNDPQLMITFAGVVCSNPGTQTVVTTRDTYADQDNPGSNFGGSTELSVKTRGGSNRRTLVYFPLPAMPTNCVLTQATLRLFAFTASGGRTIQAYQVTGSWTEGGVNWTNQPATTGTAATTASRSSWQEWDVASLVGAMYAGTNEGFLLRDQSEDAGGSGDTQSYRSREYGSNTPELVLRFG
jgi:hypothetical protein